MKKERGSKKGGIKKNKNMKDKILKAGLYFLVNCIKMRGFYDRVKLTYTRESLWRHKQDKEGWGNNLGQK